MKCNYQKGKVLKYNLPTTKENKKKLKQKELLERYKLTCKSLGIPVYNPKKHGPSFFKYVVKCLFDAIDIKYEKKKALKEAKKNSKSR